MKRVLLHVFALVGLSALTVLGVWLWGQRPWRTAVSVNGRILTARELDLRAQTLLDDAQRVEHLAYSPAKAAEAFRHFRRQHRSHPKTASAAKDSALRFRLVRHLLP